jgi:hypothetical protein
VKQKRVVQRIDGVKRLGGLVVGRRALLTAMRNVEAVEIDKVQVGAANLRTLVTYFPHEYCLIKGKDTLTIEAIEGKCEKLNKDGQFGITYHRPRLACFFNLVNRAWINQGVEPATVAIIKPGRAK